MTQAQSATLFRMIEELWRLLYDMDDEERSRRRDGILAAIRNLEEARRG